MVILKIISQLKLFRLMMHSKLHWILYFLHLFKSGLKQEGIFCQTTFQKKINLNLFLIKNMILKMIGIKISRKIPCLKIAK